MVAAAWRCGHLEGQQEGGVRTGRGETPVAEGEASHIIMNDHRVCRCYMAGSDPAQDPCVPAPAATLHRGRFSGQAANAKAGRN